MKIFGETGKVCGLIGLGLSLILAMPQVAFGTDLYIYGGGGGSFTNGQLGGQNGGISGGPKGGDGNGSTGGGGGGIYIGTSSTDTSGVTSGQDGSAGGAGGQHYWEDGLESYLDFKPATDPAAGTVTAGGAAGNALIEFLDADFDSVTVRSGQNANNSNSGARGTAFTLQGSLTTNSFSVYEYNNNYLTASSALELTMRGATATIEARLNGNYDQLSLSYLNIGDSDTTYNNGTTGILLVKHLEFGDGKLAVGRIRVPNSTAVEGVVTISGEGAELNSAFTNSNVNTQSYGVKELNVELPDNYSDSSSAMLALTGNTLFKVSDDTTINITMQGALDASTGDTLTLVQGPIYNSSSPGNDILGIEVNAARVAGVTRDSFNVDIIAGTIASGAMSYNGNDGIYATISGQTYSDAALIYSESYLAGIFSLNSGMDLLQSIPGDIAYYWKTSREFQGRAKRGPWEDKGVTPFLKGEFSRLRHKTGSHVNHENYSLAAGATYAWDTGVGQLILGGFLEGGNGTYDSYNSFTDPGFGLIGDVHGSGDTDYFGGGVLLRHDFDLGVYTEASLRGGKVKHDFSTSDLYGARDTYDADTGYWGGHFGLGYKTDIYGEEDALDIYAKFIFTHQNSQEITNSAAEKLSFDAVNSVRARVGAKASHQINDVVRGYAGVAFEHEFDSELTSRINGSDIETIGLKGHSLIGEVGVKLTPLSDIPFSVDAGAFFIGGERKGGGGSLALRYDFQ